MATGSYAWSALHTEKCFSDGPLQSLRSIDPGFLGRNFRVCDPGGGLPARQQACGWPQEL